jgi:hypothetical protein
MGKIRAILRYHDFDDLKKRIILASVGCLYSQHLPWVKIGSSGTLYIERFGDRVYI